MLNSSMNLLLVIEVLYPTSPIATTNITADNPTVIKLTLKRKFPTSAGFIRDTSLVALHNITTHKNSVPRIAIIKADRYSLKKLKLRLV